MTRCTPKSRRWFFLLITVVGIGVILGMSWGPFRIGGGLVEVQDIRILMDTSVSVKLYSRSKKQGQEALEEAFRVMSRIDRLLSVESSSGDLARINNRGDSDVEPVSEEFCEVLARCQHFSRLTGGVFDVTIGSVKSLWDFKEPDPQIPDSARVREALKRVGYRTLRLKGGNLHLGCKGARLDFGGAAKGYAVDLAIRRLQELGIPAALVDAGGDLSFYGRKPGKKDWRIAVRHPREDRLIMLSQQPNTSIATSGDYERYFIRGGIRYHHILDPMTGYPARECVSVSVWAPNTMDADIFATAIFVMGSQKGLELVENIQGVETLIFYERDSDGAVEFTASSGVKNLLKGL